MKRNKTLVLSEFIEGLNDANGAASQLIHHYQNPKWMAIRDILNFIRDGCIKMAVAEGIEGANKL